MPRGPYSPLSRFVHTCVDAYISVCNCVNAPYNSLLEPDDCQSVYLLRHWGMEAGTQQGASCTYRAFVSMLVVSWLYILTSCVRSIPYLCPTTTMTLLLTRLSAKEDFSATVQR